MHIGTLTIVVHLHDTESLKDKRQIIKSLIETTRQKFNVSIAEVDSQHVNRVLDKLLDTLESNPAIDVGAVEMEID
jgi:uncharacterized protein YlxP (DUF503 family)